MDYAMMLNLRPKTLQTQTTTHNTATVDFVNQLLSRAVTQAISDIHIEPFEEYCRIRLRHDGLLREVSTIAPLLAQQINTRLKIMSNLNIAEKRLPQDGRLSIFTNQSIDIRINTCPTLFGEKIVLRLLYTKENTLNIAALGMTGDQQQLFIKKLTAPQGFILVAGPTGCGKTTTLYAALNYLNRVEKNIITIEDPIEIALQGINQVAVNTQIGLSFAHLLRALLRQDPDIMMIGEIRDKETAAIALEATTTGHLVLSTLHAQNAAAAFSRLKTLGITQHDLIQTKPLIISQRLVRMLCKYCKNNPPLKKILNQMACEHCYQGYVNRIGIFEMLTVSSHHKNNYLLTLNDACLLKIQEGLTTQEEICRVLGEETH